MSPSKHETQAPSHQNLRQPRAVNRAAGNRDRRSGFYVWTCDTVRVVAMAKFYIDIHEKTGIIRDEEGAHFSTLEDAFTEAKHSARDLVQQYINERRPLGETCVSIRDEHGQTVAALTVADIINSPEHPAFKSSCPTPP